MPIGLPMFFSGKKIADGS